MKNSDRGGLKNPRTTAESHEPDTETSSANGGLPRRQLSTVRSDLALLVGVPDVDTRDCFGLEIGRSRGTVRGDCGGVATLNPETEMMTSPGGGEVRIKGYRAEDTDNHSVRRKTYADRSEPRLSQGRIRSPAEARDTARRPNAATDTAANETVSRR